MRKIAICAIMLCMIICGGCTKEDSVQNMISQGLEQKTYDITMKRDLFCIMMAYPGYVSGLKKLDDGSVYIVMKSGNQILYDDKKEKTLDQKLRNADLQDMMEQIYPLSDINDLMAKDFDPGRIRVYSLLNEVYGDSKRKVQSNLVNVKIGSKRYQFNKINIASQAVSEAMKEVISLVQNKKELYLFVFPISGTFNYRVIAGTKLLSPHSFGIAIDLARDKSDYWMWVSRREGQKRLDIYPREIVKVFEKHNFVWGGKWSHFDMLHYEYRPEIILKSRFFPNSPDPEKAWYEGPHLEYSAVKDYIEIINKALE